MLVYTICVIIVLLLTKRIMIALFEFKNNYDVTAEDNGGILERIINRILRFFWRVINGSSSWLERHSGFFAKPIDIKSKTFWIPVVILDVTYLGLLIASFFTQAPFIDLLLFLLAIPIFYTSDYLFNYQTAFKAYDLSRASVYICFFWYAGIVLLSSFILALLLLRQFAKFIPSVSGNISEQKESEAKPSNSVSTASNTKRSSTSNDSKATVSPSDNKRNASDNNKRISSPSKMNNRTAKLITVSCPKCGHDVSVNCRYTNGQSSDTGHCSQCGKLVYVLYENSSFGFRVIRVWG